MFTLAEDALKEVLIAMLVQCGYVQVNYNKPFKLSAGGTSPYYVNIKAAMLFGPVARIISQLITGFLLRVHPLPISAFGGMATGGYSLVSSVSMMYPGGAGGFVIRKDAKDHGVEGNLDGQIPSMGAVVLLDDVWITGASMAAAMKVVASQGAEVSLIVPVVDRQEDQPHLNTHDAWSLKRSLLSFRELINYAEKGAVGG